MFNGYGFVVVSRVRMFYDAIMLDTKHAKTAESFLPAIRGMLYKMGFSPDQIEDLSQSGFVHLATYALPAWNGKGSLKTFATQAVKNLALDFVAKKDNAKSARDVMPSEDTDFGTDGTTVLEDTQGIVSRERAELDQWLAQAMERLTGPELKLLAAVKRAGGNWSAAARELGISAPTACRARKSIKAKFEAFRDGSEDEE
jgi:RNA polymerase sigma factor (sigma-70 family)